MRKLYLFNMMTLDGFFEGPNHDLSWHNVDGEFDEFAIGQLDATDLLIFGRVTYEMMASYWPTPTAIKNDPIVAGKMNSIAKIVCSRSLTQANWNNTRLIKDNIGDEVTRLKQQSGKGIGIFGSAELATDLVNLGLIDEFRIMVNPVVLGKGRPLFRTSEDKLRMNLLKSRSFHSGNILLYYQPSHNLGTTP
jgi:dihydrofolate reductase